MEERAALTRPENHQDARHGKAACYSHARLALPRRCEKPPIVLGYHGIADIDPAHDPVRLFVSPARRLRAQVTRLKKRGYELVHMAEFARRTSCPAAPPRRGGAHLRRRHPRHCRDGGAAPGRTEPARDRLRLPWAVRQTVSVVRRGRRGASDDGRPRSCFSPGRARSRSGPGTNDHTVLGEATSPGSAQAHGRVQGSPRCLLGRDWPQLLLPALLLLRACPPAARQAGYTSAVTCGPAGGWVTCPSSSEKTLHTPDGSATFALKSRGLYYGTRDLAPALRGEVA